MVRIRKVILVLAYAIALLGFILLVPYLDNIPRLLFPAAFIGSLLADRAGYELRGRIPTVISILLFVFYAVQFNAANLVGPAVNLLVVLLAVRLASEKTPRNFLQIFALALFALAGSSLFSLDAVFLLYLLLLLLLVAVSLVVLTFHETDATLVLPWPGLKSILSVALLMPAAAVPLMLLFFFIMPRAQVPIWNFLNVAATKATGFSEKVQPGSAATVGEEKGVAFRASCARLAKGQLYWRGIVLNVFRDNAWVRENPPAGESGVLRNGEGVSQTIYPEPAGQRYLFALNVPRQLSGIRAAISPDFVATRGVAAGRRVKYGVLSVPDATIGSGGTIDREFYLRLPSDVSPRILSLGREIGRRGKNDEARLQLLEELYRSSRISYATTALPVGRDPLDEFLFVKKRGHCEFFASSLAVLLRAAGVPSRLVGGYYGGDYNELGGYYIVTEAMAHVWVEAYISGRGWVTIDPSQWAVNSSVLREAGRVDLLRRIQMSIDAFGYYWNLTVINYDLERQVQLFNRANTELKRLSLARLGRSLLPPMGIFMAIVVMLAVMRRWRRLTTEERLLRKFQRRIREGYQIEPDPASGLLELADRTGSPQAREFASIYSGALYQDRRLTAAEVARLIVLLKAIGSRGR